MSSLLPGYSFPRPPHRVRRCLAAVAFALSLAMPASAEEAKPARARLSDEAEKAFGSFINSARDARKAIAKSDLAKLCDEVATSVKLSDEQRKKLEAVAAPSIDEACDKFAEKLDTWLRPFLVGYGDRALTNLAKWRADQFASRPNVASSPQDSKAWEAAVHQVLNPEQLVIYRQELGDKTARRKREIANFLKEALVARRTQLAETFKLEREGIAREIPFDKDRMAKFEAAGKTAMDQIIVEDEKAATEQLLGYNEETWRQMYGGGGTYQFEGGSGSKVTATKREGWTKALASVLTPEELKRWEEMLTRRQQRRDTAAMMGAVAEMEDKVLLNAEQRSKLEKVFLERWRQSGNTDGSQLFPMNLLRQGTDKEVRDLLTKEQLKRWDAFVRGGYNNRHIEPPKPDAAAALEAMDADRVFSTFFVKMYHSQRDRMIAAMQDRVDEIVRVTKLEGEPLKLVQVAAKGSVERVLDSGWKGNVDRNVRSNVEGVAPQFLDQRLESLGMSHQVVEPPESHDLWLQTLQVALTDDQQKAYDNVISERTAYRDRAVVKIVLAQLDATLRLTGEQGDKLEPLLAAVVNQYWTDYERSFNGNNYAITPYYLPVMLAGVAAEQRKEILTPEQIKLFDSDIMNRYSGWWENLKRMHDQRVKGQSSQPVRVPTLRGKVK